MLKIALVTNFNIPEKLRAAADTADKLIGEGGTVLIAAFNRDKLMRAHRNRPEFRYLPIDSLYAEADIIIVLGGDGSILEAARRAATRGTPILGINFGRLGYMAELEAGETDSLHKLFTGDYTLEKRSMLRVDLLGTGGELKSFCYALNDAVVSNGSVARVIDLELRENGESVTTYRADGLIIATPTGSTAYSMSAGGAIVDPTVPCFCVTPICPHSFAARPLIFSDRSVLEIRNICVREKQLYLTVDGKISFEMGRGQSVRVTRSGPETKLVRFRKNGFYRVLCQKLQDSHF